MGRAVLKAFIIGSPVSHSLSPKLHGYWLKEYAINGDYEAINVPPEYLAKLVRKLPEKHYVGGNVTIPHKEKVMMLCDSLDGTAKAVGAVNTLVFKNGKTEGYNTDVFGFMENLKSAGISFGKDGVKSALILGAGGAARAAIFGLKEQGVEVIITNRSFDKAQKLAGEFGAKAIKWEDKEQYYKDIQLLINTTPLGMKNQPELEIDLKNLPPQAIVHDIVYNPLETGLLRQARELNLKTVDGLGMLLHQAVRGFELWFGKKPEVTAELRKYIERLITHG